MARLSAKGRKRMKKKQFVYPKTRSYPIHDKAHARAALAFSKRKNTKGSHAKVKAAVCKKYPGMSTCKKSSGSRKKRRR
jgi:hypothetical protein